MNLHLLKLLIKTKTLSRSWAQKRYDHLMKNPTYVEREAGAWGKIKVRTFPEETRILYDFLNPPYNLIFNTTTGEVTKI